MTGPMAEEETRLFIISVYDLAFETLWAWAVRTQDQVVPSIKAEYHDHDEHDMALIHLTDDLADLTVIMRDAGYVLSVNEQAGWPPDEELARPVIDNLQEENRRVAPPTDDFPTTTPRRIR